MELDEFIIKIILVLILILKLNAAVLVYCITDISKFAILPASSKRQKVTFINENCVSREDFNQFVNPKRSNYITESICRPLRKLFITFAHVSPGGELAK